MRKSICDLRAFQSPSVPLCLREIPNLGKPYGVYQIGFRTKQIVSQRH
jgi:hypothetical protein